MLSERNINQDRSFLLPHIEHLRSICSDFDDDLLSDMIEGDTSIDIFVGDVVQLVLSDEAAVDGIKGHQRKMTERRQRLEARIGRVRTLLASVIASLPGRKYRHALATLSAFDVDPKVIIQDESVIPTEFWIAQDPKLNESMIRRHLLERQKRLDEAARSLTDEERRELREIIDRDRPDVPGAILGNGDISVRIRVA